MGSLPACGDARIPGADELLLRPADARDRDALVALQSAVHADPDGRPNSAVGEWTRELFDRAHPAVGLGDITVVEDRRSGAVVSSLTLVRQTWSYAGVPLGVGRLELVATHPRYRRRGLIRRQMAVLHEMSAERGDLLQAITDLMFFHGEFGYHSALVQRAGRGGHRRALPPAPPGGEPAGIRPATPADIPALMEIDRRARSRALLTCPRDETLWRYELDGRGAANMVRDEILVIESSGAPVGYAGLGYGGVPSFPIPDWLPGLDCPEPVVSITALELLPEASWLGLSPSVLRQLTDRADADEYLLWLGPEHPAYDALGGLLTRRPPSIGWFVRVPDLPALLTRVAPILEGRLAASVATGFTGTLRLHFYTHGLRLDFGDGRLERASAWAEHSRRASDASMPEQMFAQLLFGHATLTELEPAFPDCRIQTETARILLPVLFPKQASSIWPVI